MSIKREDIDRRIVDFSDVAPGRRLPPIHPGEILRDEFLTPMRIESLDAPARLCRMSSPVFPRLSVYEPTSTLAR
jgi:hypothetical protein